MAQISTSTENGLYLARQPILDAQGRVFGYELLYRGAADATACTASSDLAAACTLSSAVTDIGLHTLTNDRRAFLNFTGPLVTSHVPLSLPRAHVVIELLETIAVDAEVMDACRDLQAGGFTLALDDFVPGSDAEQLLPYVAFVKVDVLQTSETLVRAIADRLVPRGIRLVAEKVETAEMFTATRDAGYTLFQGYHFCRPVIRGTTPLATSQVTALRLLSALHTPDLTVRQLEELIKHDASLSYRVLRCINSAAFGLRREVTSMQQALVLLGVAPIRSWASVWCLADLNTGGSPELMTMSVVRARCCEVIGERLLGSERAADLFLVGICSLLDTMLGRRMEDVVSTLPLSRVAADALLGTRNHARAILEAVVAYERGHWEEAATLAGGLGLTMPDLAQAYTDALGWAGEMARAA